MNTTVKLKNQHSENKFLLFYRFYESLLIISTTIIVANTFLTVYQWIQLSNVIISFFLWTAQPLLEKIFPFIMHRVTSLEQSIFVNCIKGSFNKYLTANLPILAVLFSTKVPILLILICFFSYNLLLFTFKKTLANIKNNFGFHKFDTTQFEHEIVNGTDIPYRVFYTLEHFSTGKQGLYELRLYQENNIPTFVLILPVDSYSMNEQEMEYTPSPEALPVVEEWHIWQDNPEISNYIPIYGVTFVRKDENGVPHVHIEFAPDNTPHGLK